jgi:hypothetical protein
VQVTNEVSGTLWATNADCEAYSCMDWPTRLDRRACVPHAFDAQLPPNDCQLSPTQPNPTNTPAQPFEFVAGERVSGLGVKKISEGANGLFAGSGGPTPPPALSRAVLGMRKGGKVGRQAMGGLGRLGGPHLYDLV